MQVISEGRNLTEISAIIGPAELRLYYGRPIDTDILARTQGYLMQNGVLLTKDIVSEAGVVVVSIGNTVSGQVFTGMPMPAPLGWQVLGEEAWSEWLTAGVIVGGLLLVRVLGRRARRGALYG